MTTQRTYQGAWRIGDIVSGQLVTRQYFGYTKREAIAEFKVDIKKGTP